MTKLTVRVVLLAACLLMLAGVVSAGEKKLMHCFAFTPKGSATAADWEAFYKATDALPGQIQGLSKVWYGKLARPLTIFNTSRETAKQLAGGAKEATGPVTRVVREYGVCMEFADQGALKAYATAPAHKTWDEIYQKVRESPTTTYDILGQ